jgi:hypothetical protein
MKAYCGSEGIAPRIIDLSIFNSWTVVGRPKILDRNPLMEIGTGRGVFISEDTSITGVQFPLSACILTVMIYSTVLIVS